MTSNVIFLTKFDLNFITYISPVKPEGQAQGCILRRSMVINPLGNDSHVYADSLLGYSAPTSLLNYFSNF